MSSRRSLYEVLGVARDADGATIEAAYHGRSLRFRVGLFDDRPRESTAPTRAEVESAYATLRDPIARARYDAEYFGAPLPAAVPGRGRRRTALWIVAGLLVLLAIFAVGGLLVAARPKPAAGDPIGRILGADAVARATLTARAATGTSPLAPAAASGEVLTPATAASPTSTSTVTLPAPAPTSTLAPTATAISASVAALPAVSPTATVVPPATPPPAVVIPLPTPAPEPPPPPFPATDWVGTSTPVNVRAGPGTNFVSLRTVPYGTLLAATGATRTINGVLWREFQLMDGTVGWMRDIDVFPAH